MRELIGGVMAAYSRGDVRAFVDAHAETPNAVAVGAGERHWAEGKRRIEEVFGPEIRDSGIELRLDEVQAYEDGGLGWCVGRATFVLPQGTRIPARVTGVGRNDGDGWKLQHFHVSVTQHV
jgi:ketosteroid isomerase-like protein